MSEHAGIADAPAGPGPGASSEAGAGPLPIPAAPRDYLLLLKPRVMSLVIFTGLVGLVMAPASLHPVLALTALVCIAAGAGAAGALNMALEAEHDSAMRRTARRPIPAGRIAVGEAGGFGASLAVAAVSLMGLAVNWTAAVLLALTIVFYVGVYTLWLKPRTPQNIVIGGAAGAFPPMIGYAAVTGTVSLESLLLFAIIFFWTPPHFWALALLAKRDYAAAGLPMLPVVAGEAVTRRQIFGYTVVLAPLGLAPVFLGMAGPVFAVIAAALGAGFLWQAWRVLRAVPGAEIRLFGYSIVYLFALFAALAGERIIAGIV